MQVVRHSLAFETALLLTPPLLLCTPGDTDIVAAVATVVCELHHTFSYFHWTVRMARELQLAQVSAKWTRESCVLQGFTHEGEPGILTIGPYQGALPSSFLDVLICQLLVMSTGHHMA